MFMIDHVCSNSKDRGSDSENDQHSPSEFEGTLDGVTDNGGTETGQERTGTLGSNDLTETTDHSLIVSAYTLCLAVLYLSTYSVVHLGFELNTGLDDIDGSESTVGDGATKSTGKREPECQR
jgi:hypothetical protein